MLNYYEFLNLHEDATEKEIKLAYRKLARKFHPDLYDGDDANEKMVLLNDIKDILLTSSKKFEYDEQLASFKKFKERQSKEAHQRAEQERNAKEAHQRAEQERNAKEAHQRAEQERSAKEAHQRAEQERSAKEAHQRAEQERSAKEAHQRAEQERSAKEAHQRAEQERSAKEAHQRAEQERKKEKIFTFKIIGSLVASFLIAIIVDLQVKNKNNTSQKVLEANSEAYSTTENDEANSEAYSTTENDEANSEAYSTTENDEANSEAYSTIESHEPKLVEYSKIENLKVEADRNAEKENIKSTDSPIKIDTVLLTKAMTDLKDLLAKNWNGDLENSITNEIENCYNNNANKKYCYYLDTSAHIVFERIVSASEGKMEMPQIFLTEPTYKRFLIFYRSYNLETHVTIGELQTSVEDLDILIQSKLSKVFSN